MGVKDGRKPIEQSIGEALASGRLSGETLKKVTALGIVAITEPFADAVFRLKYGLDAKSYKEVLPEMRKLAIRLNMQRGWFLHRKQLVPMAKEVLDYWLADTCPGCQGRGWEQPDGAPYLSDNPCMVCIGRPGKRPFPWTLNNPEIKIPEHEKPAKRKELRKLETDRLRLMKRHKELLVQIEEHERHVGEKVIMALARNVKAIGKLVTEAEDEVEGRARSLTRTPPS